eukprot:scaffold1878_cov64-Phaeocystis_antarctica.AAC.2
MPCLKFPLTSPPLLTQGCNIYSVEFLTLRNVSFASSKSSCPCNRMLDLGEETTIYCQLGWWVTPTPLSLPPVNFTGCPYTCAAGHFGNTSQEKDYTCSGECDGGGQYCPVASTQPLLCPAGTYLPVGVAGLVEASCIPCAPGAYNPDEGGANCLTCPAGKLSENLKSTECSDCPRGGSCSAKGAASLRQTFTPCPAGTFNPDLGQNSSASCQACAPGKANPIPGSSDPADCKSCSAGFVAAALGAAFCDECAPGKYQAGEGEQACVACKPGSYCAEGAPAPLPCEEGSYSGATDLSSAGQCTTTDAGYYASTGSTEQNKCGPGTVQTIEGKATCDKCRPGTYQAHEGEQTCVACEPGSYCPAGASAALPCAAGTHSNKTDLGSAGDCTPTAPGFYAPTGSTEPTPCNPGTVAPDVGKGACDRCGAGTFQGNEAQTACRPCTPGSFCPEGTSAPLPCEEGSYSTATDLTSADQCTATDKGHFAPTGSTEQAPCSPGTVAPRAEMGACNRCAAGSFQGKEGNQTCERCPISSWCAPGSSAPTACEAGKVGRSKSLMSDSDCEACPMGSWCSAGLAVPCGVNTFQPAINQIYAGACQQCPEFAVSNESSTRVGDCKCQQGYYDSEPAAGNVSCKPCPIGSECKGSGSSLALLPLLPGYWRTNDNSSDLRRCPDASSPDTTACANMNGVLCKPWATGPYCRVCNVPDGSRYFDSGQSACAQCGDIAATSLAALVGITLAMMFLFCWCGLRQPCKRLRNVVYQALPKIRAPLKQMIAFYQVRSSYGVNACAHFPH